MTVTLLLYYYHPVNQSLDELVARLNAWCERHRVLPANGQVADSVSARTLRYYRTNGLMDAPSTTTGQGYGERHFLQAASVRLLQAQGLPLNRIHVLLFGRSDDDLRHLVKEGVSAHTGAMVAEAMPSRGTRSPLPLATFVTPETWNVLPVDEDWMLVSRRRTPLPADTLAQIRALLSAADSPEAEEAHTQAATKTRPRKS